jgi:predicted transglutaminase-like cysteine proteinase
MRQTTKILAAVAMVASMSGASISKAAFFGYPRMLELQAYRIRFDNPVLAPTEFVRFCLHYSDDCHAHKLDFRRRRMRLTAKRWNELNLVNRQVNRDIIPDATMGPATEEWKISPASGNCHDYAVTKRHELLALGWPSRVLLLAEVVVPSGEHHLILVVRTKNADLVLDNLNANIRTAAMTRYQYQWVRVESPHNPEFWFNVNVPSPMLISMVSDGIDSDSD